MEKNIGGCLRLEEGAGYGSIGIDEQVLGKGRIVLQPDRGSAHRNLN